MLAQTSDTPFSRIGWAFELKYDGVRAVIDVHGGVATVTGRSGADETARYPEAQVLAAHAPGGDMLVDAEIVALDDLGRPSFQRLQPRIGVQNPRDMARRIAATPITIAVFDLLRAGGVDITSEPLRERKARLAALLTKAPDGIVFVDHVEEHGEAFFAALSARGLEGMVAKRLESPYQSGVRSPDWVKVKAWQTQTCCIVGFTRGTGSRSRLGALAMAVRVKGSWRYSGNVGSGFTDAAVNQLVDLLTPIIRPTPPVVDPPRDPGITWVRTELFCEVRHAGFNASGALRHPVFLGLRSDVAPDDCRRVENLRPRNQDPVAGAGSDSGGGDGGGISTRTYADGVDAAAAIRAHSGSTFDIVIEGFPVHLTNLDKPMWPGIPKRELVAHYVAMAEYLVPHLSNRGVTSQVFPDGISGKSFWRKQIPDHAPDWLTRWTYSGERRAVTYVVGDSTAALAWLANSGSIDVHPWHSRTDAPLHPDWAVFDLDPSEGATFADVVLLARLVKVALDHVGLRGYPKTTGQTGLQIYVPIHRGPGFDEVRAWVEEVSRAFGRVVPD